MLPYLHKYITSSSPNPKQQKRARQNNDRHKRNASYPKPSITSSCDTLQDPIEQQSPQNEQKYESDLPSTSESKVILIDTNGDTESDFFKSLFTNDTDKKGKTKEKAKLNNYKHKSTKTKHIKYKYKYWTVCIASKHNNISLSPSSMHPLTMGFGVCDATDSDTISNISCDQLLNTRSKYGYGYCVTYADDQKYQSYHTKLKSLDDILVSFNTKSNKLTLWQNGKRFNRIFQLYPSKIYAFGIKLYGEDYCIKILPNTGN